MTAVSVNHTQVSLNNVQGSSTNTTIMRNANGNSNSVNSTNTTPSHHRNSIDHQTSPLTASNRRPTSPPTNSGSSDSDVAQQQQQTTTTNATSTAMRRLYFKSAKLGKTTQSSTTTLHQQQQQQQTHVPKVFALASNPCFHFKMKWKNSNVSCYFVWQLGYGDGNIGCIDRWNNNKYIYGIGIDTCNKCYWNGHIDMWFAWFRLAFFLWIPLWYCLYRIGCIRLQFSIFIDCTRWFKRSNRTVIKLIRWTSAINSYSNQFVGFESARWRGKCFNWRWRWYWYWYRCWCTHSSRARRWRCENSIAH